jgi:hypothetical protein
MITNLRTTIWGRLKDLANAKVVQLCAAGVPNANTGKNIAGKGSLYTDITAGDIYINKGTILAPTWTKANALVADDTAQIDSKDLPVTGTTDFFVTVAANGKLTKASFVAAGPLAASNVNYVVFSIVNLGKLGTGTKAMLSGSDVNSTKSLPIVSGATRQLELHPTADYLTVVKDDRLRFRTAVVGTLPNPVNGFKVILDF